MIKSHIIGRLGKDCEEATSGQRQVLRFSVASDDREKAPDGSWQKVTIWVKVQTYQVNLKPYLTKGKQVMVSGDLKLGIWTKNDGTAQVDAAIFGADVTLLSGDSQQTPQNAPQSTYDARVGQSPAPQQYAQPQQRQTLPGLQPQTDNNEDLPF